MARSASPAVQRAVLLGASNLKMGLPWLVGGLRQAAGGPVEVLAACGHGRSYVGWSRLLFGTRSLPGIADCGLWRALAALPPLPTLALLADVGNDLLYGEPPEAIAARVGDCLARLAAQRAAVVCLPLPMIRLEKLSPLGYHAARSILYPSRGEPWAVLLEKARDLDRRVRRLAAEHGARLVEPQASWYGIDPIHVRRRWRRRAWDSIIAHWPPTPETPQRTVSPIPPPRIRVPAFGAAELRLCGIPRRNPQPALRLAEGSTLALY